MANGEKLIQPRLWFHGSWLGGFGLRVRIGVLYFWKRWVWWDFVLWVLLGCGIVQVRCLIFGSCGLGSAWLEKDGRLLQNEERSNCKYCARNMAYLRI
nr:hypothetical protein CFP56_51963 [Quercus suber]